MKLVGHRAPGVTYILSLVLGPCEGGKCVLRAETGLIHSHHVSSALSPEEVLTEHLLMNKWMRVADWTAGNRKDLLSVSMKVTSLGHGAGQCPMPPSQSTPNGTHIPPCPCSRTSSGCHCLWERLDFLVWYSRPGCFPLSLLPSTHLYPLRTHLSICLPIHPSVFHSTVTLPPTHPSIFSSNIYWVLARF